MSPRELEQAVAWLRRFAPDSPVLRYFPPRQPQPKEPNP